MTSLEQQEQTLKAFSIPFWLDYKYTIIYISFYEGTVHYTAEPRIQGIENISLRPRGVEKEYIPTFSEKALAGCEACMWKACRK